MNTNTINYRKHQITEALKSGTPLRDAVAPGEFLALVAHLDPLSYGRGSNVLGGQLNVDEDEQFEYEITEQLGDAAVEVARQTYLMDDVRAEINRHKFANGLLADDEILAFALFLVVDSALVNDALDSEEMEFDDVADLINHVAKRIKFLLSCIRNGRLDILNTVIQYTKLKKTENIDTVFLFPTFEADDGGTLEYYKAMTDKNAYRNYFQQELDKSKAQYEESKRLSELLNAEEDDEDAYSDNYEDDREPLVERDFEC